jgi:hypothetical protein
MNKKLIALVLAFALVFSSFTAAFADTTTAIPVDAQAAKDLGMLVGSGNGVTIEYLGETPTRLQSAIMFLRLKGLEQTALSYTSTNNFADADQVVWAGGKNIMAYLNNNPQLGWAGIGANKFNPNVAIDAASYYKVMLETLGYKQNTTEVIGDFTWEGVKAFAATKGLVKVANTTNFTVNEVATATIEALKATVKGSTKTLATTLVEAGVITEAAAIAAGVYTAVPTVLAVESVKTDNLKQLVVKFNQEIKAAGDDDNYELDADNAVIDANTKFTLQADKKTVVITLTTEAAQQEIVELTVKGIEAVNGSKLVETVVKDIELFDKTIPSAVKAQVVGNDTIKVTFSEPIKTITAADFKVDGGEVIVKGITLANNGTEVNVELFSTLENGQVSIEVGTGVKDFAGFAAPKKAFNVTVVEDTAAPVVVGYKDATPTGVTLIFNEEIQLVAGTAANFYHTNSSNVVDADITSADIDGKELTLEFTSNKLPEGTAYIYVAKEVVADLWDNENAKIAQTVQVELDKTKPTVTKVEAGDNEDELVITFSEDMDIVSAQDEDNYTILDKDGKEVANKIASATVVDEVVTILFTEELTGNYSIVIDGVEDQNGNAIVKVTKAFNISDVTAPLFADFTAKLFNAGTTGQMLKVSFDEAMAVTGKYSVLDLDKYELGGQNLAEIDNVTIKAVDGNKAVEITIPATEEIFADTDNLVIARVADAAGNYTAALASNPAINVAGEGRVAIDTVRVTSKNTVEVTLLDKLAKFTTADFIVYMDADDNNALTAGEAVTVSRVKHTINEDGMSVITFTLSNDIRTNATDLATGTHSIAVATAAVTTSENIYSELLVNNFTVDATDKAAPTVTTVDYQGATTIVITFSEGLDASTFATGKNGFSVTGGTLTSAARTAANQVTLTGTDFTANTNVYYTSVFGLKDANNNNLADIAHTDVLK